MSEQDLPGPLAHHQPTNQYNLRSVANAIIKNFGHASGWSGTTEQAETVNAAYRQLLRAANQLERIEKAAKGE